MLKTPSLARDFYQRVKKEGAPFLRSLVNSSPPTFETDWLDFKGAERLGDKDLKRIWSECIVGFANTQGGVLIWGIDARKHSDTGIDAACGLSLAENPGALESRLRELQSQSADPPVPGVEYWSGKAEPESNGGFVVCFVPESRFKPHRAEAAGKQYYIRAGSSFCVPSPALLRSLFYPEYHAHLCPEIKALTKGEDLQLLCFIHNTGIATARNVMISIDLHFSGKPTTWNLSPLEHWYDAPASPNRTGSRRVFMTDIPIHPGMGSRSFTATPFGAKLTLMAPRDGVQFNIAMYAENNQPLFSSVSFSRNELEDNAAKQGKSAFLLEISGP